MKFRALRTFGLKGHYLFPGPVELHLDALPPGVIALVGPNGHGKTTTLEAMFAAFWGVFPSHEQDKLAALADRRDAYIVAEAEVDGGDVYLSRVNLDGVSGETDAVLDVQHPNGRREVLNDGKVSTWRATTAALFPARDLVLASAYAAQNKNGSFVRTSLKDRRALFAQLLGLAQFEARAATARAAGLAVDRRLAELRVLRQPLITSTSEAVVLELARTRAALEADALLVDGERALWQQRLDDARTAIDSLRARAERYAAIERDYAAASTRQSALERDLASVEREAATVEQTYQQAVELATAKRDQSVSLTERALEALPTDAALDRVLEDELAGIAQRLEGDLRDRRERLANNHRLYIDRADEIRAAVAQRDAERYAVDALRAELQELTDQQTERAHARVLADQRAREIQRQQERRAALQRQTSLIDVVPCHGSGQYAGCQFLQDARAASAELDGLGETKYEQALVSARQAVVELDEARATAQDALDSRRRAIAEHEATISTLAATADLLPKVEVAETRVADLERDIVALGEQADEARATARARRLEAGRRRDEGRARLQVGLTAARTEADEAIAQATHAAHDGRQRVDERRRGLAVERDTLGAQIAALEQARAADADAYQTLHAQQTAADVAQREVADREIRAARLEEQLGAVAGREQAVARDRQQRQALDAAIATLEQDLVDWELLAKVLGRDGLPVLEIDAAGPGVSALANDLLQACFGARFTVQLVTQEPKADGKGFKEVFELKVYDAERGGEAKDLATLSGGEQVIVDEALKSAIALYVNQRNDWPLRTCWRDETAGALDEDNALRYMAMLRRIRERGGFHHLFVVLHNLTAAAHADAQIVIAHGRLEVLYPPFPTALPSSEAA